MVLCANRKIHALSSEETLSEINNYVRCAVKHNGVVYGGYVRDVIATLCSKMKWRDFNNLNLWFKTQEDANNFVKESKIKFKDVIEFYALHKIRYEVNKPRVTIEIIVSDFYPVCDFSVNLL